MLIYNIITDNDSGIRLSNLLFGRTESPEEGIGDSVRPTNKFESQGESIQDNCKTSNDVRCRDLGSDESTREEVGCGGNEDVKMDEWSHQAGQNSE